MKKLTIMLLIVVASSVSAFGQMQVWRNGTIIFSHDANDVDSISFAGNPMKVQTNTQSASGTLALDGLCFESWTSNNNGAYYVSESFMFMDNANGALWEYRPTSYSVAIAFTYTLNGSSITINAGSTTYTGYVTQNGLMLSTNGQAYGYYRVHK